MAPRPDSNPDPGVEDAAQRKALHTALWLWRLMPLGQAVIAGIALLAHVMLNRDPSPDASLSPTAWLLFAAGVSMGSVVLAPALRTALLKAHWQGLAVTPSGYTAATTAHMATLETGSLLTILIAFLSGRPWYLALAVVPLAFHLSNRPSAAPMQPQDVADR